MRGGGACRFAVAAGPATWPWASGQGRTGALASGVPGTRSATAPGRSRTFVRGRHSTRRTRTNRESTRPFSSHCRSSNRARIQLRRTGRGVAGTGPSVGPRTVSTRLPGHALAQPAGATAGRRSRGHLPHAPATFAETGNGLHRQGIRRSRPALPAHPGQYRGPAFRDLGAGTGTAGTRATSRPRVVPTLSRDPDPDIPAGGMAESRRCRMRGKQRRADSLSMGKKMSILVKSTTASLTFDRCPGLSNGALA